MTKMTEKTYWNNEHSAYRPASDDAIFDQGSQSDKHLRVEEEIWALFRELDAEPDASKRNLIRQKIWDIVENGGSGF
ncbi:hypothetical protein [Pantoea sp. S18]|uniref:hypothetical protein n=2 Tax=Pantoea sp. S18 TaxID=3019892 RepID=UPI002B1F0304|nr:hypothetical protein [Pantoea sp. S18]MEA5105626.1 hypothetical protein [Pantoea sp. S18]